MNERAKGHGAQLAERCLVRIVGPVETGVTIVEAWLSADDARRFSTSTRTCSPSSRCRRRPGSRPS
jgi:hypothetical protein